MRLHRAEGKIEMRKTRTGSSLRQDWNQGTHSLLDIDEGFRSGCLTLKTITDYLTFQWTPENNWLIQFQKFLINTKNKFVPINLLYVQMFTMMVSFTQSANKNT